MFFCVLMTKEHSCLDETNTAELQRVTLLGSTLPSQLGPSCGVIKGSCRSNMFFDPPTFNRRTHQASIRDPATSPRPLKTHYSHATGLFRTLTALFSCPCLGRLSSEVPLTRQTHLKRIASAPQTQHKRITNRSQTRLLSLLHVPAHA